MTIHGTTPAERAIERAKRTRQRRARHYLQLMSAATTPTDQLRHACDYARAVAKDLPADRARNLAAAITRLADAENQT